MNQIFAEHAWLAPGRFTRRVLVSFDDLIREVRHLPPDLLLPPGATPVQWLTPGFINAHCHLEYTWLSGRMPGGPLPFGHWMKAIMATRPSSAEDLADLATGLTHGAQALLQGGCTTVFDSTTDGASSTALEAAGIRHYLFHEVLGLTQQRAEPVLNNALQQLFIASRHCLGRGLNPHAPYSVGPWLRSQLQQLKHVPQAWHLAETRDEDRLFQTGTGSIADVLKDFGLPRPFEQIPDCSPFQYLKQEGQLESTTIAFHGNQLSLDEAMHFSGTKALVHCPGTHRWFQREKVPLRRWLDAGVNVCLGTDSLASADSLSMLNVVSAVAQDHAELSADDILTMACYNPCHTPCMPGQSQTGTIKSGSAADLVAIESSTGTDDWAFLLQSGNAAVKQTWIAGTARL